MKTPLDKFNDERNDPQLKRLVVEPPPFNTTSYSSTWCEGCQKFTGRVNGGECACKSMAADPAKDWCANRKPYEVYRPETSDHLSHPGKKVEWERNAGTGSTPEPTLWIVRYAYETKDWYECIFDFDPGPMDKGDMCYPVYADPADIPKVAAPVKEDEEHQSEIWGEILHALEEHGGGSNSAYAALVINFRRLYSIQKK